MEPPAQHKATRKQSKKQPKKAHHGPPANPGQGHQARPDQARSPEPSTSPPDPRVLGQCASFLVCKPGMMMVGIGHRGSDAHETQGFNPSAAQARSNVAFHRAIVNTNCNRAASLTCLTYKCAAKLMLFDAQDPTSASKRWTADSRAVRSTLGVSENYKPWTSRRSFLGVGLPSSERILDVLDCYVASELKENCGQADECARVDVRSLMDGKFIDVSQGVKRGTHSNKSGFVRTFTTSTILYDFSRDVVLSGYEMLLLHGFPREFVVPDGIPETEVRKVAGDGMSIPSLAAVIWCLYLTRQFPE